MKVLKKMLGLFFVCILLVSVASAKDKKNFSTDPQTNDGKKWRIGFYEGGPYIDYQKTLIATVKGLMEMGWVESVKIPEQKGEQTKELWNWLSKAKSKYIEFVKDAHYSAGWNKKAREKMAAELINRLNQKADIDIIIASGTWAGQDIANDKHKTPAIVVSTSDPIKAGIIKSIEDSGFDHVHARVDPFRYERQIRLFYDIINFKKMGIVYENTSNGKIYAAIDKVEKVAQKQGFEIVRCYAKSDGVDLKVAEEEFKKCLHELGKQKVDGIYITIHGGVTPNSIPNLVNITNSYKIPTFSQSGSQEVKYGFLMSIAKGNFEHVGLFYAKTIATIFNGAKPGQLEQIFESPPKLAINLKTANIIGYDPSMDVLGLVDETYQDIKKP